MTINTTDIGTELAEKMGLSKSVGKAYVEEAFDIILNHLENGDDVNIRGFGKFEMRITPPKKGRNMVTGKQIDIPSKRKIKFAIARSLSDKYSEQDNGSDSNIEVQIDPESEVL